MNFDKDNSKTVRVSQITKTVTVVQVKQYLLKNSFIFLYSQNFFLNQMLHVKEHSLK